MPRPGRSVQKKICMVGASAVGKTSLVRRFVTDVFSDRYMTTVGVKIEKKEVRIGDRMANLILWDFAGDDELQPLRMTYLRGAAGYVLVADGTRPNTLDKVITLQRKLQDQLGAVPFVLAVNKVDQTDAWRTDQSRLDELAAQGWWLVTSSARTGEGVDSFFHYLAEQLLNT